MRLDKVGIATIVLTTGQAAKSTGGWIRINTAYSKYALRCCRATSIGTSNFSVKLYGTLSTVNTTGAAVGIIGAYVPSVLISYTQANVGTIKVSTGNLLACCIKYSSTAMTTAANRKLRVEVLALP